MDRSGPRAGISLLSLLLFVAPMTGAGAQQGKVPPGGAAPARAAPAARAAPQAAPAIRSAPPAFSRPAPSFHAAPQRPAFTPRSAPQFAAPSHRVMPQVSRSRLSQPSLRQRLASPKSAITRAAPQRDRHIQALQSRVRTLQTQQPRSLRAQRLQQRRLQNAQQSLQRQQRRETRQQRLQSPAIAAKQPAPRSRFATRFQANMAQTALMRRSANLAPHRAWRRGWHAAFVPWLGPVFWPYVYSDIFDYAFWPGAYDPGYWAYLYDDFIDTVFWAPDAYSDFAYAPDDARPSRRVSRQARVARQAVEQVCNDPGKGVTAWPFAEIDRSLALTAEQRPLLDEMKAAATKAAATFKSSCPQSFAMTPPGRLQAMASRIDATLEAVRTVRPALEKFYNALTDEQKAGFNAIGPNIGGRDRAPSNEPAQPQANACGESKSGLTQFPVERIEQTIHLTDAQKQALDRLRAATEQAIATLQAECPDAIPLTPVGRLETMQARLEAIAKAAQTVRPALDAFYASLDNEQKARFNTLNAQASR